jgi:hypothetical protein
MYQVVTAALRAAQDQAADALLETRRVLAPGGLFFYGVYGGTERDEPWEDDDYIPQHHIAFYLDNQTSITSGLSCKKNRIRPRNPGCGCSVLIHRGAKIAAVGYII